MGLPEGLDEDEIHAQLPLSILRAAGLKVNPTLVQSALVSHGQTLPMNPDPARVNSAA